MAYTIKGKKVILEQGTNDSWMTKVTNYFNKMNDEQKKALENTISLCTQCKSDMDNNKSDSQSCVACKNFSNSMNDSKKIKVTESQFNSVIKKLINNESSLLNEERCGYSVGDSCKCSGNRDGAVNWAQPKGDTQFGNSCAQEGYYCSCGRSTQDGPQKVFNRTSGACNCGKPSCEGKITLNSCVSCCKADDRR